MITTPVFNSVLGYRGIKGVCISSTIPEDQDQKLVWGCEFSLTFRTTAHHPRWPFPARQSSPPPNSVTREKVELWQQSYRLDNFLTTNHRDVSCRYRLVLTNCTLTDVTDVARIAATGWHSSKRALGSELLYQYFSSVRHPQKVGGTTLVVTNWNGAMISPGHTGVAICCQDPNGGELCPW
jgi:hypothetical protein